MTHCKVCAESIDEILATRRDVFSHAIYGMDHPRLTSKLICKVLALLTPREERVLRLRFGLGVDSDHTLEEVGRECQVSGERIRQIEVKALRKIRNQSALELEEAKAK